MPLHLRIALVLCVFGLAGAGVTMIGPKRPAAASGSAVGIAAGGELTCRRIVKVGPLGVGARCVPAVPKSPLLASSD